MQFADKIALCILKHWMNHCLQGKVLRTNESKALNAYLKKEKNKGSLKKKN